MKIKLTLLLILSIFLISGCEKKDAGKKSAQQEKIVVAKIETPIQPLYFSGLLNPIKIYNVLSPVEGRITKINFQYGGSVKNKQLLAILSSQQLADNFHKAVDGYLQAKETYNNGKQSFNGTQMLYKAGITNKDEYLNDKSTFENNTLKFFQARNQLKKVMEKAGVTNQAIFDLSIADTDEVNRLLQRKFNDIKILATGTGIALFPISQSGDSASKRGRLQVGAALKENQLILSIGDLTGFSLALNVSEINISKVKEGMPAVITGDAFPGLELKGVVTRVSSQAEPNQSGQGDLSVFSVHVNVPNVEKKYLSKIHVGMTAKVQINIKKQPEVMVPINAVYQKDGRSTATVIDASGQRKQVNVLTGDTTPGGMVAIIQGVKAGEKVVVGGSHD